MSEETDSLNYLRIVGSIPMPSQLERREAYNLHVLDYLSWQFHPGWTITQAMGNPALAYCVAMSIAKPAHLYTGP
jgi:hypothetical protein